MRPTGQRPVPIPPILDPFPNPDLETKMNLKPSSLSKIRMNARRMRTGVTATVIMVVTISGFAGCGAARSKRVPLLSSETQRCQMVAARVYRADQQGCGSDPVCHSSVELEYDQRLADCERR